MLCHLPRNVIGNSKFQDLSRLHSRGVQIALTSIRAMAAADCGFISQQDRKRLSKHDDRHDNAEHCEQHRPRIGAF